MIHIERYRLNGISLEKFPAERPPLSALVADLAAGACENQVDVKFNIADCAGLARPARLRVTNFPCEALRSAEPDMAQMLDVGGVVVLQLSESAYTFQWWYTQGGDQYVAFTNAQFDTPLKQEVIAFDTFEDDDAGEARFRAVIDGLARRICFSDIRGFVRPRPDHRLLSEATERVIAEQVFKALLRQGGCDAEGWGRSAEPQAKDAP